MDGTATMSEIRDNFRTPVRILLPKLLKSRDGWKAKSHQRKAELKTAKIKIRDLLASRNKWRERAKQLQEDKQQLQERLAQAEREVEQARAAVLELEEVKKK
jgi:chromosome segregation ATPase